MTHIRLGDLALDLPEGWTCSNAIFTPAAPGGEFLANIVVTREVAAVGETPRGYAKKMLQRIKEAGIPAEVQGRRDLELASGRVAAVLELVVASPTGPVRQLQVIDVNAGFVAVMTASERDGEPFEQARSAFLAVARSVQ